MEYIHRQTAGQSLPATGR